jgi:SAM-dependent methyltransferase
MQQSAPEQVTEQVSELYESFPYPAHGIISSVLPRMARSVVEETRGRVGSPRYIDAGCGTGEQTLGMKQAYPELDVTGIDYSEASLVFARNLSSQTALGARFERRNLMEPVQELGEFDLLTSIGALQTLPDPAQGFRTLRAIAKKDALFLGMVYGTYGKWDLFRVRDVLNTIAGADATREAKLKLLSDIDSKANSGVLHYLTTFQQRRRFGPAIAPTEALKRVLKGRSASYQADAFTCPQELTYTWTELAELLAHTGWEWQGWPQHSGMPDVPSQVLSGEALARVERMTRLEQASIFERLVCPGNLFFIARAV